jgi:hypothetical protein
MQRLMTQTGMTTDGSPSAAVLRARTLKLLLICP